MDPVGSINLVPISQKDAEEASKNSIPNEERSNHEVKMNTLSLMNQGRRGSLLLLCNGTGYRENIRYYPRAHHVRKRESL